MIKSNTSAYRLTYRAAFSLLALVLTVAGCNSSTSDKAAAAADTEQTPLATMETSRVYVGTYAGADNESIFLYSLNIATGELTRVAAIKAGENPSFLALDGQQSYLYAVNETASYDGSQSGAVSAFTVNQQTGGLTFVNKVASEGAAPCYIALDDKTVLVANYTGGNVAAFPIQENGALGKAASVNQHEGKSINQERQEGPHAHFIAPTPDKKFVYAVDLGIDKVLGYQLQGGKLVPGSTPVAFASEKGAGPRQLAFHPTAPYAYLIHELANSITALRYNSDTGALTELQTILTLPAGFKGESYGAAVRVSPDGKFLYGSNRGHNSIVVYAIDENTGGLTLVQHAPTGGDWPRDFNIDASGSVLLVANERSNNIVTFKIDASTGMLTPTGHEVQVPKPVSILVAPALPQ